MQNQKRFSETIQAFDDANRQDPHLERVGGEEVPKELLYAQRMTEMLNDFAPEASEALQLAARCQHIRRWEIPRETYPMDRKGYLLWRSDLKKFHSELASGIMRQHGYEEDTIQRVTEFLQKRRLKTDPEVQTLEDVICLVFLKYYFAEFSAKHPDEKIIEIVQKTWKKMSDKAHKAALQLSFSDREGKLIEKALGE
jgi:hypothetical protein